MQIGNSVFSNPKNVLHLPEKILTLFIATCNSKCFMQVTSALWESKDISKDYKAITKLIIVVGNIFIEVIVRR